MSTKNCVPVREAARDAYEAAIAARSALVVLNRATLGGQSSALADMNRLIDELRDLRYATPADFTAFGEV